MNQLEAYLPPLGRLFLCGLFVWGGVGKLMNPSGTAQFFAHDGVPHPGLMVWVAIAVELLGGLALLAGFKTRWAAAVLAAWCLLTGFAVHLAQGTVSPPSAATFDNMIHFYKNLAMAGGLLYVVAFGAGALSVDNSLNRAR
jgi:putative oxidoreductase